MNGSARGLGGEFLEAVEECMDRIAAMPGSFPVHRHRMRRALTRRFPYLIFYVAEPDEVVVVAGFHAARDPRRWP